jgi:hypothetical protein
MSNLDLKDQIEVRSMSSEDSDMLPKTINDKRSDGDMRVKFDADNVFIIRMNKSFRLYPLNMDSGLIDRRTDFIYY